MAIIRSLAATLSPVGRGLKRRAIEVYNVMRDVWGTRFGRAYWKTVAVLRQEISDIQPMVNALAEARQLLTHELGAVRAGPAYAREVFQGAGEATIPQTSYLPRGRVYLNAYVWVPTPSGRKRKAWFTVSRPRVPAGHEIEAARNRVIDAIVEGTPVEGMSHDYNTYEIHIDRMEAGSGEPRQRSRRDR